MTDVRPQSKVSGGVEDVGGGSLSVMCRKEKQRKPGVTGMTGNTQIPDRAWSLRAQPLSAFPPG